MSRYWTTFLSFLTLIFALSSCDPEVQYTQIVQNDSNYSIWIIANDSSQVQGYKYEKDSFLILRNSERLLFEITGLGGTSDFENCDIYADSLTSRIDDDDTLNLTIDLNKNSNWTFKILKNYIGRGGICECRLIINNGMVK